LEIIAEVVIAIFVTIRLGYAGFIVDLARVVEHLLEACPY
jgi:hypothetical protein